MTKQLRGHILLIYLNIRLYLYLSEELIIKSVFSNNYCQLIGQLCFYTNGLDNLDKKCK